jgi:hypothetical protein
MPRCHGTLTPDIIISTEEKSPLVYSQTKSYTMWNSEQRYFLRQHDKFADCWDDKKCHL